MARVFQQQAGGGLQRGLVLDAEGGQIADAELIQQQTASTLGVELPVGAARQRAFQVVQVGMNVAFRQQNLARIQAHQFGAEAIGGDGFGGEAAARQGQPGQRQRLAFRFQCQHHRIALVIQQRFIGDRAGRDDAHHLAFHRPLAGFRVADLLADRHRFAQTRQLGQIGLSRVIRHPGHADRLPGRRAARGQRDVEQARGFFCVVMEQLVKVAHAIEQQHAGMLGLDAQVLLHHRGVGFWGAHLTLIQQLNPSEGGRVAGSPEW